MSEENTEVQDVAPEDNKGLLEEEVPAATTGHNSDKVTDIIVQCAKDMVAIDSKRKLLNREASDVRERLVDNGIDKEAFKEEYAYYKKKRHERDGFDESRKLCHAALGNLGQADMFDVLEDAA